MTNPLVQLQQLGQSPWLDNIRRAQLTSGELRQMVRAGDITGLTSNPSIFEQAIGNSTDYDATLAELAHQGKSADAIFDALAIEDIRAAADIFAPTYKRTRGADGFVSLEVAPRYAADTAGTIREARRLWRAVDRPNLMVKIPATQAGLPAIEQCLADGLNINITLIFALERYAAVMEAYLAALEHRARRRKPLAQIASVASFFVSRVDTLVDKRLDALLAQRGPDPAIAGLKGQAAIANARLAYAAFRETFGTERFAALEAQGARLQRPLWASTSTKNPAYPDVYYVEALVGPDTVNTLPPATLAAYKDHGQPAERIEENLEEAQQVCDQLAELGIEMDEVTRQLEEEGVAAFAKSFDSLIATVETRRLAVLAQRQMRLRLPRGETARLLNAALDELATAEFGKRLWAKDPTLWKPDDPAHQKEIAIRLGWVDVMDAMRPQVPALEAFRKEARKAGFTHALLCGMGGSSLAPEVLREVFGVARGALDLAVLDSTDPEAVLAAEARSKPGKTLYIIASKSGGTTEPNAMFQYFWQKVLAVKGKRAGENFVAVTDPGTAMEKTARKHRFRRIFLNPPEIGGRYSALSLFGLVPAALLGVDVARLLDRADEVRRACGPAIPVAQNAALTLGAVLGTFAREGRDKLTLLTSPRLAAFGYWVEQLIAESTGKEGVGIVPVEGEPLAEPAAYGRDRVFVHWRLKGQGRLDAPVTALAEAGQPVIELLVADPYDLGGEFLRWELATAAAGWLLGINPFDQPNVQESKTNTVRLLAEQASGRLPAPEDTVVPGTADFEPRLLRHLKTARRGDYVALTAYFARTPAREKLLRQLQASLRDRLRLAVTVGYGPRFLHSTGQLHKGGPNNSLTLQMVVADEHDVPVPGERYTFGTLKAAQALGDYQALQARGRRVLRLNLGDSPEAGLRALLAVARAQPIAATSPRGKTAGPARRTAKK